MNTAEETALLARLDALDRKLDLVLAEVEEVRRFRREAEELKDDLARVGKDLFRTTTEELEGVAPFVQTGDFAALAKRVIRNVNSFNELLVQLESAREFFADATPLARQVFSDGLAKMDELDRKGYFAMARELQRALDNVVANFTVEDVRLLADNLVAILQTVRQLTQPQMLQAINNAVEVYQKIDFDTIGVFALARVPRGQQARDASRPRLPHCLPPQPQRAHAGAAQPASPALRSATPVRVLISTPTINRGGSMPPSPEGPGPKDPNPKTTMATRTIANKILDLDAEGFLTNPKDWDLEVAKALAAEEGIATLTDRHIVVLNYMRKEFETKGDGPSIRKLTKESGVPTKELYELFPGGPAKKAARIAGIKKPHGCI